MKSLTLRYTVSAIFLFVGLAIVLSTIHAVMMDTVVRDALSSRDSSILESFGRKFPHLGPFSNEHESLNWAFGQGFFLSLLFVVGGAVVIASDLLARSRSILQRYVALILGAVIAYELFSIFAEDIYALTIENRPGYLGGLKIAYCLQGAFWGSIMICSIPPRKQARLVWMIPLYSFSVALMWTMWMVTMHLESSSIQGFVLIFFSSAGFFLFSWGLFRVMRLYEITGESPNDQRVQHKPPTNDTASTSSARSDPPRASASAAASPVGKKTTVTVECPQCHSTEEIPRNQFTNENAYKKFQASYSSFFGRMNFICVSCERKFKMETRMLK